MSHRVSTAHVVGSRSLLIEGGADHVEDLLDDIERQLENADLGGRVHWTFREVVVGGGWPARGQPWLVVEHRHFPDVRQYVRCRAFGAHLELVHLTAVEPPAWKRWAASLLVRDGWWSWSLPRRELDEADLRSWLAVVGRVVSQSAKRLAQRAGRGGATLRPADTDVLAWW